MEKEKLIKSIEGIINNNYSCNLDESEAEILLSKIDELNYNTFSQNTIQKLNNILSQIESHLKSGMKTNPEFNCLIKQFKTTKTNTVRKEILHKCNLSNKFISFDEINKIVKKYGNIDLIKYFNKSGNKYSIYLIDYEKKDFVFQEGEKNEKILDKFETDFRLSNTNISALYKQFSLNDIIDVFMVNEKLIKGNDRELFELIIFHEICHLLEKTQFYKDLGIIVSNEDKKVGLKLHSIANKVDERLGGWGLDNDHNALFGSLLFYFFRQFSYNDRFRLLGKSMIKNLLDDYTEEFQNLKEIE